MPEQISRPPMPELASRSAHIGGPEAAAWDTHYEAMARQQAGEEILLLSVGQESEPSPAAVVEAAAKSLRRGRHHYTPVQGEWSLREMIARTHAEQTGQVVSPERVTVLAGAQNALFSILQLICEAGDEVLLPEPYYATYPAAVAASGARGVRVAPETGPGLPDADLLIGHCTARTRAIVLNSPNNPLGAIYPQREFDVLAGHCAAHGIWLVHDAVYQQLVQADRRTSAAAAPDAERTVVTLGSLSKACRMTGWRIGWAVVPEPLVRPLYHWTLCMSYGLPPFIMDAAQVALDAGDHPAAEIRARLSRRRARVAEQLKDLPAARLYPGECGMFCLLDIRRLPLTTAEFARRLLDEQRVSVLPGEAFGASLAGFIRISLCVNDAELDTACKRLIEFLTANR